MSVTNADIKLAAESIVFVPTKIEEVLRKWSLDEEYRLPDELLVEMFDATGSCVTSSKSIEYKKVCLLDQIYSTYLSNWEILEYADYLSKNALVIQDFLRRGDCEAVSMITKALKSKEQGRFCYSFATKYCYFAAPKEHKDEFPVFDRYVMTVLNQINAKELNQKEVNGTIFALTASIDNETNVKEKYESFKKAIRRLRDSIQSERKFTLKEIDQYIWYTMHKKIKEMKKENG